MGHSGPPTTRSLTSIFEALSPASRRPGQWSGSVGQTNVGRFTREEVARLAGTCVAAVSAALGDAFLSSGVFEVGRQQGGTLQ